MTDYDDLFKKLSEHGELLGRIDERGRRIDEKMEVFDKRLDSHAGKIRALEHWRFWIMGIGAAAVAWLKLD